MPPASQLRVRNPLTGLLLVFAASAAVLWLLPLFAPHSVLFPPGPDFEDILVYKGRFTVYHSLKFFTSRAFSGFAYPPGAAPIYAWFYSTQDAVRTYLRLSLLAIAAALAAALRYLRHHALAQLFPALLLLSFPLVFLVQRANIELVLWLVIASGIVLYRRGLQLPAAFLFGLAAAVKLYPILLLGLFLRRRQQLPAFLTGLITAATALVLATAYTGPTFVSAASGFSHGVGNFQSHYVDTVSAVEVAFDHSLFSPLKYQAYLHHGSPAPWTRAYYICAGTLATVLFLRVRSLPSINRLVFLVTAMVCLPPVSFNYTLVHLYVPLLLLLGTIAAARSAAPASAYFALALILGLMLPLISLQILSLGPKAPIFPAGPLQACLLCSLLIVAALAPWPDSPRSASL